MKNIHHIVYLLLLIPLSSYSTEKQDHVGVIEEAKKCFGSKIDYKKLEVSLANSSITASNVTKYYATSKTGNTLFICGKISGERSNYGYIFNVITLANFEQLKEYEEFRKFALSALVSLKICSTKYNLKIPKPLAYGLLKDGFTQHPFDHFKCVFTGCLSRIDYCFPQHKKIAGVFVDDNGAIAINFKDEHSNNILWAYKLLPLYMNRNSQCCIVPKQAHVDNCFVAHHPDLCSPGIIQRVSIKKGIKVDLISSLEDYNTSTLKVKKDNKKYIIDLPL